METNEQLVRKAISAADALASAGQLNATQANTFLDYVIDETSFRDIARIVRLDGGVSWEISKIGVGNRVLMAATEGQDPGIRRGVTTSKLTFTPTEFILPVEITDGFVEENVAGRSAEDQIMRMFGRQLGNNFEDLCWHGRTLGPAVLEGDIVSGGSSTQYVKDGFMATFNGWLAAAEAGNVVDHAGAAVGTSLFSKMIKAMPTKFRRNKNALRQCLPSNLYQNVLEQFSNRQGAQADSILTGGIDTFRPYGIPTMDVPLFGMTPTVVEHVTLSGTTAVSLRYKNFADVVVTPSTLGGTLTTKYVLDTDYGLDAAAGTIARIGGSISDGQVVKVTYSAPPSAIMTPKGNLIVVFSRDIRIESERDIMRRLNRYVITLKAAIGYEEATAIVHAKNISETV